MIKAVFFDLYHTLVGYAPPREETEAAALKAFGIEVTPAALLRPLVMADEYIYQEMARLPLKQRSEQERLALFAEYQAVLLREAGIKPSEALVRGLLGKVQLVKNRLVPFDDTLPALEGLKQSGLILGLISNVEHDIAPMLEELGLAALLSFVVTSVNAGFSKPHAGIFRAALARADIRPVEALYIGDQYQVDILGARVAGIKGILLDRNGFFAATEYPRMHSLTEIARYLQQA